MPVRPALLVAALGLLLSGCGPAKLDENKSYTLDPGGNAAQVLDLPAIAQAQKVTVAFTSSATDVTVYLIKDFKDDDGKDAPPSKAQTLGQKQGKEGSFVVEVPAKTPTRVVVRDARSKTEVTLKLTNSR